jgi:carboxymethylenebutenolidase
MPSTIRLAADSEIKAYLSAPDPVVNAAPPWPGVVVIHDAFGLGDDVKSITDRFATAGHLAIAPDLYSRGGAARCIKAVFTQMRAGHGRAFDDVEAARAELSGRADCTGKVGVVGFCMGGGFALVAATKGFDAAAPYYGMPPADMSILDDSCPVVASFGKRDRTLPGVAGKLEAEYTERGIPHDVKEYPNAGHSFANRMAGPFNVMAKFVGFNYDHESSEDAYRRVQTFFHEHLR